MACYLVLPFQAYAHVTVRSRWSLSLDHCDMRRSVAPIATDLAPRHHVHMEVRSILTGDHAVVLNQVKPVGVVCLHKGIGHPADSMNHGDCLFIREIWESWGMTPRNNENLPDFKLSPVHECKCHVGLFDSCYMRAAFNDLAKIAGITWNRGLTSIGAPGSAWNFDGHDSTLIFRVSPNPPMDRDGRREDSGRG